MKGDKAERVGSANSAFSIQNFQYDLEAWHQIELPEPSASRAIERPHVIDLGDREAEQVDAHDRSDTRHRFLVATGETRARRPPPGHAGVSEDTNLHGNRSVEAI